MDSQAIALFIAAGGLVLGLARFILSIMSYRLDARRSTKGATKTSDDARPDPLIAKSTMVGAEQFVDAVEEASTPDPGLR